MALKLAGEEIGIQEKVEGILYEPGLQDSGDLEAGTKTITATSKPGTADYTTSLTIPASPDSRLVVTRLALRGNIHIDSFGGSPAATKLYCTVECNGVEKVSAKELTSEGADNLFAVDITADFNLGTANELKVYLWVDQGQAVVSVCQLWLAWGTAGTELQVIGYLRYHGLCQIGLFLRRQGTGTPVINFFNSKSSTIPAWPEFFAGFSGHGTKVSEPLIILAQEFVVSKLSGSVSTDINFPSLSMTLRRLQ